MPGYQPRHDIDRVFWNGVQINSSDWLANGYGWRITGIYGWDDGVEIRDAREQKPGQDGEDALTAYRAGRTITIEGEVDGATWEDLQTYKRSLASYLTLSSTEQVLRMPATDATTWEAGSHYQRVNSQSPAAFWRFQDTAGTTLTDYSGNGRNGVSVGSPTKGTIGPIQDEGATPSYCWDFNGSSQYATVAYSSALNPSGSFTVAGWVRRDVDTGAQEFIVDSRNLGDTLGYALRVTASDKLELRLGDGAAASVITGATSLAVGTWYHVAATFDGSTGRVYVNGVLDGSGADAYSPNTGQQLTIGCRGDITLYFNGAIDDLAVFPSVLSTAYLLELYNQGTSGFYREITRWERAWCRIIEPITFGEKNGPLNQSWQVVFRASDPRIFSDLSITDDSTVSATTSTAVASPMKITVPCASGTDGYGALTQAIGGTRRMNAVMSGTSGWNAALSGFTTATNLVLDSGYDNAKREAYITMPANAARKLIYRPVWMYRLNETAGVTADNYEDTAGYDGTINGTPSLNQTGPLTDTKSILFDAVNDSVSRAYVAAMHTSEFTLEGWFKDSGTNRVFYDTTNGTTTGIQITGGSGVFGVYNGGTSRWICQASGASSGAWNHFIITHKAGTWVVYLNGAMFARVSGVTFTPMSAGTMYLGRNNAGTFWGGYLSSFAYFSTAFSQQVAEDMYNSGSAASICRYRAGVYISDVVTWPEMANSTITFSGSNDISSGSLVAQYRTARH